MGEGWTTAPMWEEWRDLTRLQWSGRIAFETELDKWKSPYITDKDGISVVISDCGGDYKTSLENHLATLANNDLFCSLIFLRSYALMENHAKLIKFIVERKSWELLKRQPSDREKDEIDELRLSGGIENWADELIVQTGQDWSAVYRGKAGLVEMSLVRNALMHGYSRASSYLLDQAARRGGGFPFTEGEAVRVSFSLLHEYRGRVRSFCRIIGDGVVHYHRGTHRKLSQS